MRFNEFNDEIQRFTVSVRVVSGSCSTIAKTRIEAQNLQQAKAMLTHLFGEGNVLSITQQMAEDAPKVLSPQEQQVKSMSEQAKRLQQQAKQVKARSKLQKAQQQLAKATTQSVDD